jgi:hypothetical protein
VKTRKFVVATVIALMMGNAQAALFDRGGGMIYDDALNITWLQDANYAQTSGYDSDGAMNWATAGAWADGLSYGGYDDWRLPTALHQDGSNLISGCCDTKSEMGHMIFNNFGGTLYFGKLLKPNTANLGLFSNLQHYVYWTGTGNTPKGDGYKWTFYVHEGFQVDWIMRNEAYAWAVRDGDIAAPIPEAETYAMMLAGLGVMGGIARRRQGKS